MAFSICPPAFIYLVFSVIEVIMDTSVGLYNTALVKFVISILMTYALDLLCKHNLGVVAWIFVFIPFILKTIVVAILLLGLGLSPSQGSLPSYVPIQEGYINRYGPESDHLGSNRNEFLSQESKNFDNFYELEFWKPPDNISQKEKQENE